MQGNQTNPGATAMGQAISNAYDQPAVNQSQPSPAPAAPSSFGGGAPVGGGLRGRMMTGRAPWSRENNGRDLAELAKKVNLLIEASKADADMKDLNIRAMPVARGAMVAGNFSNAIGMMIFTVSVGSMIAYHTLLLSSEMAASSPTRNDSFGYNIETVQAPRTATTVADEALAQVIRQKVTNANPQSAVMSADWSALPVSFKMSDDVAIEELFYNCVRACWQELQYKDPNFTYEGLSAIANDNSAVVSIHNNQDQSNQPMHSVDATGLPIRDEILIDFRSEQQRTLTKDMQTENTANVVEFGQVMAMVSLNIDPVAARQNQWGGSRNIGPNDTQEYTGEITITGFNMLGNVDLANTLLMISTAFPLLDTNSRPWLRNFLPRHLQNNNGFKGSFRPRDLGALNYHYRWSDDGQTVLPFGTSDENTFKMQEFNNLTSMLIQPGAALAIDIPECGATTWFLRAFAECNDVPAAADTIIKAANGLTDGRFSQFFDTTSRQITVNRPERVLLGYYPDDQGTLQDIRKIDMLYLLNAFGHDDPEIGQKWAATWGQGTDQALAARAKLIEERVAGVVWTGIGQHRVFTADFLMSLDKAIGQTGLKIRNELGREDARMMVRHSAGLAQSGALMTNFTSGMFTTGSTGNQGGGSYRSMAHTRQY